MKCLRNKFPPHQIIRVRNAEAETLVALPLGQNSNEAWIYTTKSAWKAQQRKPLAEAAE
jgi:hypothetical protein